MPNVCLDRILSRPPCISNFRNWSRGANLKTGRDPFPPTLQIPVSLFSMDLNSRLAINTFHPIAKTIRTYRHICTIAPFLLSHPRKMPHRISRCGSGGRPPASTEWRGWLLLTTPPEPWWRGRSLPSLAWLLAIASCKASSLLPTPTSLRHWRELAVVVHWDTARDRVRERGEGRRENSWNLVTTATVSVSSSTPGGTLTKEINHSRSIHGPFNPPTSRTISPPSVSLPPSPTSARTSAARTAPLDCTSESANQPHKPKEN